MEALLPHRNPKCYISIHTTLVFLFLHILLSVFHSALLKLLKSMIGIGTYNTIQ